MITDYPAQLFNIWQRYQLNKQLSNPTNLQSQQQTQPQSQHQQPQCQSQLQPKPKHQLNPSPCKSNPSQRQSTPQLDMLMLNVQAELTSYQLNGNLFTATFINGVSKPPLFRPIFDFNKAKNNRLPKQTNCFVISPYANLVNYATDELHKLPTAAKYASQGLIKTFAALLRQVDIDKVQVLANTLMATNVVSQSFLNADINQLTQLATQALPEHTLMIRSLNESQHADYINKLKRAGWLPVVNRQVYLMTDWQKVGKRRDVKRDLKLLKEDNYQFIALQADSDLTEFKTAETLYNQLYLHKYTPENVQFTGIYMQQMVQAKLLSLNLLLDKQLNRYVGMVATIDYEDTIIVPMVGYDTGLPQTHFLYRRLMIFAINQAKQRNCTLHLSAGAPQFKRHRGAVASIEYMMVYTKHLPNNMRVKKAVWYSLSQLSLRYYAPLLQKLAL